MSVFFQVRWSLSYSIEIISHCIIDDCTYQDIRLCNVSNYSLVWYNCVTEVDNGKVFVTTGGIALKQLLLANSWDIRIQVRLAYDTFDFNLSICLNHRANKVNYGHYHSKGFRPYSCSSFAVSSLFSCSSQSSSYLNNYDCNPSKNSVRLNCAVQKSQFIVAIQSTF